MKELFQAITLEAAWALLEKSHPAARRVAELIPITEALDRQLAEPVVAGESLPAFAKSTVDGIAAKASDTFGASESLPALLMAQGSIEIGTLAPPLPLSGNGLWIATGAMLPAGADAVVMVEYTQKIDDIWVEVYRPVAPGENVLQAGEDVGGGQTIFPAEHRLRSADLGLLAALGITRISAWKPLRVGIISTGNELVEPDQCPEPGQIRDSNSISLGAATQAAGGKALNFGIVRDSSDLLKAALQEALEQSDLVLISGGSSVGTWDLTHEVLCSLGGAGILFHGLNIKPGKPTLAALVRDRLVIGLPGHPAAALVAFHLLVKPMLSGTRQELTVPARLSRSLASAAGRDDFIRVRLERRPEDGWIAEPVLGKSGLISTMAGVDGMIHIPAPKQGLEAGEQVEVLLF